MKELITSILNENRIRKILKKTISLDVNNILSKDLEHLIINRLLLTHLVNNINNLEIDKLKILEINNEGTNMTLEVTLGYWD